MLGSASFNAGSQALLKYLLLGACGAELKEPTVDFDDQPLEDMVIVVSEDGASVFHPSNLSCTFPLAPRVMRAATPWGTHWSLHVCACRSRLPRL